jgi:hypothetical protein
MNSSTIIATSTFLVAISPPGTGSIAGVVTYDATNNIGIFTPSSLLLPSTTYKVTITTGVESVTGVFLASNFVYTFTTSASANTTAPTVISENPVNGAPPPPVPANQKITATFSEQMDSETLCGSSITVTCPAPTFTLADTTISTPVSGTVTYSLIGATATFTPASDLIAGHSYSATITTGATDITNPGNALKVPFTWTFTAGAPDTGAPTITLTTPASAATAVPTTASVNATFSKAMDVSTLNGATFTLTGPGSTPITGKVTYDATNWIVTFTPNSALAISSTYTATITTGAKDLEGNALASGAVPNPWNFTTGTTTGLSPGAINLGAGTGFEIFARAAITNTGTNTINGDMGLTPKGLSSITGFFVVDGGPGIVNGSIYTALQPQATAGLTSLQAAYIAASPASIPGGTSISGSLAGSTLFPGVYASATTVGISGGNLTLDAQGDQNAVWIIQVGTALTLTAGAPSCDVILANGAQAANVFWWIGTAATIGTGCAMVGNIMTGTSISFSGTGATLNGRALAGLGGPDQLTGAVTIAGAMGFLGACSQ